MLKSESNIYEKKRKVIKIARALQHSKRAERAASKSSGVQCRTFSLFSVYFTIKSLFYNLQCWLKKKKEGEEIRLVNVSQNSSISIWLAVLSSTSWGSYVLWCYKQIYAIWLKILITNKRNVYWNNRIAFCSVFKPSSYILYIQNSACDSCIKQ